jgi:CBS domain-containing protein
MNVAEVMTRDVRTCAAHVSLDVAARAMWEGGVGCTPVVDHDRTLVGMITDRDVCMAAHTQGLPLVAMTVSDTMSRDPVTLAESSDLAQAATLMRDRHVRRLPVVDENGRLVGMLSLADLVLVATRAPRRGVRTGLTPATLADTMAATCSYTSATTHAAA